MKVITIILGGLLVVGGIYCVFSPVATYSAISWLIGLSMVVEGVGGIITWSDRRKLGLANGWTLAGAIISILLGVFLLGSFLMRFAVDMFIAYLIAIWLVVAGVTRIVAAIAVRNSEGAAGAKGWIGQVVLGVLIVILGILCIFNPLSIWAGVGLMLGLSIVLVGIGTIMVGFEM
ncbi:MAG: DUF308 domain-containing protein [Eggerthellaceae bacterium]|nr:DUF308 domain-containing protein [Eggerthellaceae bacterium]